ncbi:hypothetical protein DKP79_29000, partial [Klebsiella pneumoniae]
MRIASWVQHVLVKPERINGQACVGIRRNVVVQSQSVKPSLDLPQDLDIPHCRKMSYKKRAGNVSLCWA